MKDIYKIVVGQMKIEPNYFLDEMSVIETDAVVDAYNENYRMTWEQVRWLGYVTAQSMTGAYKSPQQMMPFDWDEKPKETTPEEKIKIQEHLVSIKNKKR